MINIKKAYSHLINFLKTSVIEERLIEYENGKDIKTIVSINGIYSLEIIKNIISCLFNKGRLNLIDEINSEIENGNFKLNDIEKTITFQMGILDETIKSIGIKNEYKVNLNVSELNSLYDKQTLELIMKEFSGAINIIDLTNTIAECVKTEIEKIPEISSSLIITGAFNKSKKDFGLKEDFIKKHADELYYTFCPKFFKCSKEDFISFCKGKHFVKKINFNTQAELITFIKWFKEKNFLLFDEISWKYIVSQCSVKGESKNPDSLRRLFQTTNSPNIADALNDFLRHIKNS
jgi:hypothetical protein